MSKANCLLVLSLGVILYFLTDQVSSPSQKKITSVKVKPQRSLATTQDAEVSTALNSDIPISETVTPIDSYTLLQETQKKVPIDEVKEKAKVSASKEWVATFPTPNSPAEELVLEMLQYKMENNTEEFRRSLNRLYLLKESNPSFNKYIIDCVQHVENPYDQGIRSFFYAIAYYRGQDLRSIQDLALKDLNDITQYSELVISKQSSDLKSVLEKLEAHLNSQKLSEAERGTIEWEASAALDMLLF